MKNFLSLLITIMFLGISCGVLNAWQNPCALQNYDFIMSEDYVLMNFTDDNTGFGPRPDCAGEVIVLCPDNRECVLPYGVWGNILVIGENMYDMNFKLIEDNHLVPQNNAKWEDVLARNGCPASEPEPDSCGPDHMDLCENQTACEFTGGHWYNGECNRYEQPPICPECPTCDVCPTYPTCPVCEVCPECPVCEVCDNITADGPVDEPFTCSLIGNVYRFDTPHISYSLSNFRCEVGPGCRGICDLRYGNFDVGPTYIFPLPFSCQRDSITIFGLPCAIHDGDLRCLDAEIEGYYYYHIGNIIYCFPEKKTLIVFEVN